VAELNVGIMVCMPLHWNWN